MTRIIMTLLSVIAGCAISFAADKHQISFEETEYDFGTITVDHGPVTHEYEFTNAADVPLTVLSVSASCGCTRPKYTHEPVRPGEKGKITVTFDPKKQRGYISKEIRVRYKTAGGKTRTQKLKITGQVTPENKKGQ